MEDRQGQQLGNYKLLYLVGQGGFADVYLGEHIHLRTQAAIKVLQVRLGESNIQSFLNEARTIAHLIHPYIVRVLDFGVQDNIPFLVMDYAPHGTFRQRFLQGMPLPEAPLVPYMKQTAAALQYGHDKNLIHRDVKPENMLLGLNDDILLSDFGLALISDNSISRPLGETVGTAAYMAPEQLQGKPRPASDQYALGMIAYEWLAGHCPFQGSFFEIASQQVLAQPPSLQEKAPGTSIQVEKVVMRALEKDPQQRFPNLREFALALEEACIPNKHHSLDLPRKENTTTRTNVNTSLNSTLNINGQIINQNLLASPSLHHPFQATARTEASSPSEVTSQTSITPPPLSPMFQSPNQPGQINSIDKQPAFINEQLPHPNVEQEEYAQNNQAAFSMPSFASGPASYLTPPAEEPPQKKVPTFPIGPIAPAFIPLSISSSPPRSTQPPTQAEEVPFMDFPPLSPVQMPNSIDSAWASIPSAGAKTFLSPEHTYLSNSQKFRRTTLSHLKAVAMPIYKDNHFRSANMIIILLVMFIIVASGIGIFALSNNQKAMQQQNITATSSAAKANRAKASQTARALQASQTAVVRANPYVPTNGGLLVLDDPLTGNKKSWQVGPDATGFTAGKCVITNQGYQVDAPSVARTPCFQTTQTFTNFAYQIDLTFKAIGQSYSGAGIIFRSNSNLKQYYYFEIFESGNYTLQKCTKLNCVNYMDGYRVGKPVIAAFQKGINVTNTLAVVANGNTIDLFVNKQKISEITDQISTPYVSGLIGVMATAGNNLGIDTAANTATSAIFNNAKVWKL